MQRWDNLLEPNDWRAAAFLLERMWPQEYARTERIEQVNEQADDKKVSLNVYYNNDQPLARLLDFPNAETDSPDVAREKQRRLLEQMTTESARARKNLRCASA